MGGVAAGLWKGERAKKTATLRITPFEKLSRVAQSELTREADPLLQFVGPDAEARSVRFGK